MNKNEADIQVERTDNGLKLTLADGTIVTVTPNLEVTTQPQPEPWARWRATADGDGFWKVSTSGKAQEDAECFIREDDESYNFGNYFRTQELAERHAKRLRSMVPTCAMPKDGDEVWTATVYRDDSWSPVVRQFEQTYDFIDSYQSGRLFTSRAAAEAWIAEFGDAWTTRVEGEGE